MILFLDYDGVLHPDPCLNSRRLFENVPRLNASLEEFPEVCLVLSTSWRTMQGLKELMSPLPEGLQSRVLGTTPIFSSFTAPPHLMPYKRHAECVQWMVDNDQSDRDWFAVDDRPAWFAPYCDYLIDCDSQRGFDDEAAARLRFALLKARQRLLRRIDTLL